MLRSVGDLRGAALVAVDSVIGSVEQVFFDDEKWVVRYVVVRMGRRLGARRVLVSPRAVVRLDPSHKEVAVRMSRAAVATSPDIDTRRPVSRQKELEYHRHFSYPLYWNGVELWGTTSLPIILENIVPDIEPASHPDDVHLRSSREVARYRARGADSLVGRVTDFVFDADTWKILYLRVDAGRWSRRRKLLVPHRWVASVSWRDRELRFSLPGHIVRNAPSFESLSEITAEAERGIAMYYEAAGGAPPPTAT